MKKCYNIFKAFLIKDSSQYDIKSFWDAALLKYMQMHAFAYILTRLFIAMKIFSIKSRKLIPIRDAALLKYIYRFIQKINTLY